MLNFMGENKRLLNIHEQKFAELAVFQANTIVFQANTNASLKNLETQIGQLALNMQNQSKGLVPSDIRKDPRECMVVLMRSGRKLDERRVEKKDTEEEKTTRMQPKQQVEKENPREKEEVKAYEP